MVRLIDRSALIESTVKILNKWGLLEWAANVALGDSLEKADVGKTEAGYRAFLQKYSYEELAENLRGVRTLEAELIRIQEWMKKNPRND